MTLRSLVLVLALCPAGQSLARIEAFRFDPERVPAGRVYPCLRSNRDGSHAGNMTLYVAAQNRLEALEWEACETSRVEG